MKRFFNLLFHQETSRLWAKTLRQDLSFSFFEFTGHFGTIFPQIWVFFLTVSLRFWGFGRKVPNSVFKIALKIWRKTFLFFVDSSIFFSRNLSVFCRSFGKKNPAVFSKQVNTCAEDYFGIFSNCFHFSLLSRKLPNCGQNSTVENLIFSFLVCRGRFGTIFPEIWAFFWLWTWSFGALTEKFSTVFSKMHWRYGGKHSYFCWFFNFFSRNLSVFRRSFGKKNPAVFSKQLNTCAEDCFGIFSNFFHFSLLSRKLPNCEQNFTDEIFSFPFFVLRRHLVHLFSKHYVFWTVRSKISVVDQKLFGSVFESEFKMCRKTI